MASPGPKHYSPAKILVLRGGALGDFVVTLPTLAALKRTWPHARVELIGNATAAELAHHRGLLDRVHSQHDARWAALFKDEKLPRELVTWLAAFDLVVNYWPGADGTLARHFPLHEGQQYVAAPAMPTRAPAAAHYADALRPLGIEVGQFFVRLGATHRSGETIAVHPGSGSRKKNWPQERWIELLAAEQSPFLLITGEAEMATWSERMLRGTKLANKLDAGTLRLATGLPLEALVQELAACRLFLGHDSGVSHLASACGVPCVLLFGPTDPAMWAPPAPHVRVIQRGGDLAAISVADVRAAMTEIARLPR